MFSFESEKKRNSEGEKVDVLNRRKLNKMNKNKKKGLLVIPGLGRIDRLKIVLYNIQLMVNGNYLLRKEDSNNDYNSNISNKSNSNNNNNNHNHNDINNNNNNHNHNDINNYNDKNSVQSFTDFKSVKYGNSWDCIIFIYADKKKSQNDEFWSKKDDLEFLRLYCDIIENPNKMVSENLYDVFPKNLEFSYDFIFILLDDCRLMTENKKSEISVLKDEKLNRNEMNEKFKNGYDSKFNLNKMSNKYFIKNDIKEKKYFDSETFNLKKLLHIMNVNNLTVASPMVRRL